MDRKIYSEVRELFINELKKDLIGPSLDEIDILDESPSQAYLTGILHPLETEDILNLEILSDIYDQSYDQLKDNEIEIQVNEDVEEQAIKDTLIINKRQNSIGIKSYLMDDVKKILFKATWGEYEKFKTTEHIKNKKTGEFEEKNLTKYSRNVIEHELILNLDSEDKSLELTNNIYVIWDTVTIKKTNRKILSVFLVNKNIDKTNGKSIYQVEFEISSIDNSAVFLCEDEAKVDRIDFQEFLYRNKPIFGKGFGCAVEWNDFSNTKARSLKTSFIPTHEIQGMSTELPLDPAMPELENEYLSIKEFAVSTNKNEVIEKLLNIAERYENWISNLPMEHINDRQAALKSIEKCKFALTRIRKGIKILEDNNVAFDAFKFMNQVMHTQVSMKNYAKNPRETNLVAELNKENFSWRPFQLAFILMNLEGIVDPLSDDRKIVDLLWFPTGGGKTEAYLGIIAFLLGYRRLTNSEDDEYNKDGGVTVILRYTLRLLTTQQRDRLMRLIAAAEYIRAKKYPRYGEKEFSIGFWVGGGVTANKFEELQENERSNRDRKKVEYEYKKIEKQVIECPCCGVKKLNYKFLPSRDTHVLKTGVEIYCTNKECYYSKSYIPVYLVDEEIYRKTPTVIISTVDKFARLPWDEKTSALFGKVNRFCEKCGYIAEGESHPSRHTKPSAKVSEVKPFYPPELIIQDELHLITGPLGTIYGLYETAIEELTTATINGRKLPAKYVAATATIKNADEQIRKVFGKTQVFQFPPAGLSVEDSFFARERSLDEFPFRLYAGICVSGQSMKTVILRVYAVLLQVSETILTEECYAKYIPYIDPYRTLIGYFNSVRELGGAVWLLADDIGKRIQRIVEKNGYSKPRYINRNKELTSRVPSYEIPKVLELLERKVGEKELDVALATNMISVGMDVDRLGLMVINGQPKQTSEYIQASSRVGRSNPGLVVTIYNPYRPRDLSHFENFIGYHSRLYNFVEGTTATPFAARARDRGLHALIVGLVRLLQPNAAKNDTAKEIIHTDLSFIKEVLLNRVKVVDSKNLLDASKDINQYIDLWIEAAQLNPNLKYYFYPTKERIASKEIRLLSRFNDLKSIKESVVTRYERPTLDSMRQIEGTSKVYIYEEWSK